MSQSAVWRVENRQRPLRAAELVAAAEVVGCTVTDFIDGVRLGVSCGACRDQPPEGFVCKTCGAGGAS